MADHLVRRHASPTTGTLGPQLFQSSQDLGFIGFPGQSLHVTNGACRTCASPAEKLFSACFAERIQRLPSARLCFRQKRLESRIAPKFIELPAGGKGRCNEVALGNRALKLDESRFVVAD